MPNKCKNRIIVLFEELRENLSWGYVLLFKQFELFEQEDITPGKIFPKLFKKDNYTVFTFVRHPFERLVSAYNDKINTEKVSFIRFIHCFGHLEYEEVVWKCGFVSVRKRSKIPRNAMASSSSLYGRRHRLALVVARN